MLCYFALNTIYFGQSKLKHWGPLWLYFCRIMSEMGINKYKHNYNPQFLTQPGILSISFSVNFYCIIHYISLSICGSHNFAVHPSGVEVINPCNRHYLVELMLLLSQRESRVIVIETQNTIEKKYLTLLLVTSVLTLL